MEKVAEHKKTSFTTDSNEVAGCEHSCERNANANSTEETIMEKNTASIVTSQVIRKSLFLVEKVLVANQIN